MIRRLAGVGAAVLVGAVLAVAILLGAGLLILHLASGGSSVYCTDSVKTQLAHIANDVDAPDGLQSHPAAEPTCFDSQDGAWTERRFDVDDRHGVAAAMGALSSQLRAGGWLDRPPRSLDTDQLYVHDFDGKRYWAELAAGRRHIWLAVSAGNPL